MGDGLETFISPPKGGATGYEGAISTNGSFNTSGPLDTFSGITGGLKSGTVNFPGGLVSGGSAFFSLAYGAGRDALAASAPPTLRQIPPQAARHWHP